MIDEDQMLYVGDSFDVTATDLRADRAAVRRYPHEHGGELVREHGEANASENSAADDVIYARAARTMGVGEVSSTSPGHTLEAMDSVFLAGDWWKTARFVVIVLALCMLIAAIIPFLVRR